MMRARIITDSILFIALFVVPWWLVVIGAVVALFFFKSYYELLIVGLLIDSLYTTALDRFYAIHFVVSILCICLYVVGTYTRGKIRFSRFE